MAGWWDREKQAGTHGKISPSMLGIESRSAEIHEAFCRIAIDGTTPQQFPARAQEALLKAYPDSEILIEPVDRTADPEGEMTTPHPPTNALQPFARLVLHACEVQHIPDTARSDHPESVALATAGFTTIVGLPCMGYDRPVAALVLGCRSSWTLTGNDLVALSGIAAHLGTGLSTATKRTALEQSYLALQATQGQRVSTERLAALGQMAAGVAHDFNNMLASIMVRAELLRQLLQDPKLIAHVEVIERTAHDGARTVRRLQEFTRPANRQSFAPVDLNAAVRDSLEITKSRWQDDAHLSGIPIEVETDFGKLPPVLGDASEIREVLTNLIVNAIDAMPQGGCLRLTTRWLTDEEVAELTVADTGMGMAEEVRAHIFDPFFTTKGTRGSGLGLSVSYGILKRHGGQITVETSPGAGTTFLITLPCLKETPPATEQPAPARIGPLRLLVIDDDEGFRVSVYMALQREGHFVAVAASGDEGLRLFRISTFDVVLTDLGMPEMSGWEVAKAVKLLRPRTPVILITGWGLTLSEADKQRPEIDAVLSKPVTAKAILQELARLPLDCSAPPDGLPRDAQSRGKSE